MWPNVDKKYADYSNEELVGLIKNALAEAGILDLMVADARQSLVSKSILEATKNKESLREEERIHVHKASLILDVPEAKEAFEALFAKNIRGIETAASSAIHSFKKSRVDFGVDEEDYVHEFFSYLCANVVKFDPHHKENNPLFTTFLRHQLNSFFTGFKVFNERNTDTFTTNRIGYVTSKTGKLKYGNTDDGMSGARLLTGGAGPTPVRSIIDEEERNRLDKAMEGLPQSRRELLMARFNGDETDAELAERFDVKSRHMVAYRVNDTLQALEDELNKETWGSEERKRYIRLKTEKQIDK